MPGIEPRLSCSIRKAWPQGRISLPRFVELVSPPTRRASLAWRPQRATLLPGADADIVLLDPAASSGPWARPIPTRPTTGTPTKALEITGKIRKVFSRGELIIDDDEFVGKPGRGRYLARKLV